MVHRPIAEWSKVMMQSECVLGSHLTNPHRPAGKATPPHRLLQALLCRVPNEFIQSGTYTFLTLLMPDNHFINIEGTVFEFCDGQGH